MIYKRSPMRKITIILITTLLLTGLTLPGRAVDATILDDAVNGTAAYMLDTVSSPVVSNVGGEWAVLGLVRSGYDVPDSYYENYYRTVEASLRECGGILSERRYTDYSRVILALTAAGFDPRDVAGYDLTLPLGDFGRTVWQGLNGPIWALIALDSLNYPIPENRDAETQATRDMYVAEILRRQTPDGGWNMTAGAGGSVGADERGDYGLTGMALQALARYQHMPEVRAATDRALVYLSAGQNQAGGYTSSFSGGLPDSESAVQVLVALCELGIPVDDGRFVKNGNSLVDSLLSFRNPDGGFRNASGGSGNNLMATEQAFYALVAVRRAAEGKNSLYRMDDAVRRGEFAELPAEPGLPGKHPDVNVLPVAYPGRTFVDITGHVNQSAIEALATRGIINGKSADVFDPDATMTRAEFAAIVTGSLGLPERTYNPFADVPAEKWYVNAVATAYYYEIVRGTSATTFDPEGIVTRQEAAVMVAHAARLAGMDTSMSEAEIRNSLAQFGDYRVVESWATGSIAFCYSEGLLDDTEFDIQPTRVVKRCEIAEMLYRVLDMALLLMPL